MNGLGMRQDLTLFTSLRHHLLAWLHHILPYALYKSLQVYNFEVQRFHDLNNNSVYSSPCFLYPTCTHTHTDWLCYDDDKVLKLPESNVVSKYAYILFYCRRDYLQTKP